MAASKSMSNLQLSSLAAARQLDRPCCIPTTCCSDQALTIRLALLLEPDLNLRFACPKQYSEWQLGLRLLLELLQQPEDLLHSSCRSTPTAAAAVVAAAAAGGSLLGRFSGVSEAGGSLRPGSSGGTSSDDMGRLSSSLCREAILQVTAAADGSAAAACGAEALDLPAPRLPSINTGRVCGRADSARQLQFASAHSRAALVAAVQRQGELKQPDPVEPSKAAENLPQEQRQPGDGSSADGSGSGDGSLSARSGNGQGPTRRNTIHLVASAQSVRGLHIRTTSSSEVPQEQQPRQQPAGDAPAAAPKQASPRGGGGMGSKAGRLRTGLRRAVTFPAVLLDRTSGRAASTAGGAAAPAAAVATAADALAGKEHGFAIEPRHQRTFTLMDWAEERPGAEAAAAQGIAAGVQAAATSAEGSPQPTPSPLPSSRLRQRTPPSAGVSGRMLLPGPFIHLIGKLARLRLRKRRLVLHCSALAWARSAVQPVVPANPQTNPAITPMQHLRAYPASSPFRPAPPPLPAPTAAEPARPSSGRRCEADHPSASSRCRTSSATCSNSWRPSSGAGTALRRLERAAAAAATAAPPAERAARTARPCGVARQAARPRPLVGGMAHLLPRLERCHRRTTPQAPAGSAGWQPSSSSSPRACTARGRGQPMLLPSRPSR